MNSLFSSIAAFRQRAVALFHRTDQLKTDDADRRARWDQVIAEHRKPLEHQDNGGKANLPQS
jgi:hypothetical protein